LPEGEDPVAFIIRKNVTRRHMSKGALAMVVAVAFPQPEKGGRGQKGSGAEHFPTISKSKISEARAVLKHCRATANDVINGGVTLDHAYKDMQDKKEKEAKQEQQKESEGPEHGSQGAPAEPPAPPSCDPGEGEKLHPEAKNRAAEDDKSPQEVEYDQEERFWFWDDLDSIIGRIEDAHSDIFDPDHPVHHIPDEDFDIDQDVLDDLPKAIERLQEIQDFIKTKLGPMPPLYTVCGLPLNEEAERMEAQRLAETGGRP
jgi:hypothetical protein